MTELKSSRLLLTDRGLATELLERLVVPILMLGSVFIFGTVGFFILGESRWDLFECAYMTSITLTTVGYGEVLENMGRNSRIFAMVLMWTGWESLFTPYPPSRPSWWKRTSEKC